MACLTQSLGQESPPRVSIMSVERLKLSYIVNSKASGPVHKKGLP